MLNKLEAARRLVNAATGEPYGDGSRVTNVGVGYAEPGYHDDSTVWVLGDWNPKRFVRQGDGEPPLTNAESIGPRLFTALERIGVEGEWLDEWESCEDCQRIFRINGDSYSWEPFYVDVGGDNAVEYLCGDCATKDNNIDAVLALFIDNPNKCITRWFDTTRLEALGWQSHNGVYENGWHPGQDDDPRKIAEQISREQPDAYVVFIINETSQFYMRFTAWTHHSPEKAAKRLGVERGRSMGSWVIDGNTDVKWCRWIVTGYDDGDPEVMDMSPWPLSAEWADDPTIGDVLREIGVGDDDERNDDLLDVYETAFIDSWWATVLSAAKAQLEPEDANN